MTTTQDLIARMRSLASGEIAGEIKQIEYSLAADLIESQDAELATRDARLKILAEGVTGLRAELAALKDLSVTGILLRVAPGDGSGHEVYAQSVSEVEAELSEMCAQIEIKDDEISALKHDVTKALDSIRKDETAPLPAVAPTLCPELVRGPDVAAPVVALTREDWPWEEQPDGTRIPVDPSEMVAPTPEQNELTERVVAMMSEPADTVRVVAPTPELRGYPQPTNADTACWMIYNGVDWLQKNAPDRLTEKGLAFVAPTPIPPGVYFSEDAQSFYEFNHDPMGIEFNDQWRDRSPEFPTAAPAVVNFEYVPMVASLPERVIDTLMPDGLYAPCPPDIDLLRQFAWAVQAEVLARLPAAPVATQGNTSDARSWCEYIAGIIELYIKQDRPNEDRETGIANIIANRLRSLTAAPVAPDLAGERLAELLKGLECGPGAIDQSPESLFIMGQEISKILKAYAASGLARPQEPAQVDLAGERELCLAIDELVMSWNNGKNTPETQAVRDRRINARTAVEHIFASRPQVSAKEKL